MCGIVGIRRWDGEAVDASLLTSMTECLRHRGPDATGIWVDGPVGFGHARLSIIDVDGSAQPMVGADDHHHITFNGEILNYRELRDEISYPYRTVGDTEALLAVYHRYGADGVQRIRGQFAYALHDGRTETLHLFRDRMGVLPLYYYSDERQFVFASELKALLPALSKATRVDEESLHDYLAHRSVPAPHTLVAGVRKLPPGHRLELDAGGRQRLVRYWQVPAEPGRQRFTADEAVRSVRAALTDAVHDAMVADVPVGAYLSGGVDSSLITALMSRARGGRGVSTYAAGFGDPRFDELEYAAQVSAYLGTDHRSVLVRASDFSELWPQLSWHRDAPISEPSDIAVYRLAELARRDVKVVLSGEGSDELFGGYPKHRFAQATRWAGLVPPMIRGPVSHQVEQALPASRSRVGIAVRALGEPGFDERMRGWFAPFTVRERRRLVGRPAARRSPAAYHGARGDALRRMLYADSHTWLSDNLLERGDRMSMAASLELRPPFLDHRLVELAFSLPSSVKVRRGVTKWVVKEVAREYVPADIVDRKKVGFRVPLDAWFRGDLREMAHDLLLGQSSFVADALDRSAVQRLLAEHASAARDQHARLWTLLSLEVWHRELMNRAPAPQK